MRDFNKIFETMATILENGEYILRQTARKMEKEVSPLIATKVKMTGDWAKDYPDFYKLIFGDEKPTEDLEFISVTPKLDPYRALKITKENIDQAIKWLSTHPIVDGAFRHSNVPDAIYFTSRQSTWGTEDFIVEVEDYIIEEFDGAEYTLYAVKSEDFYRRFRTEE